MTDMTHDEFAEFPFGKAALQQLSPLPDNFRLYEAENLGPGKGMKITGAEFRVAQRGPNKGKLSILVPGTRKVARLTQTKSTTHTRMKPQGSHNAQRLSSATAGANAHAEVSLGCRCGSNLGRTGTLQ